MTRLCEAHGLEALIVFGTSASARQAQAQVNYLTGFLGYQDAYLVVVPGSVPILFVQFYNHVPNAARIARAEVRWGGPRSVERVADALDGIRGRIGLVGPVPYQDRDRLAARLAHAALVDVSREFVSLRLVKSEEEIEWMQRAASITDAALSALLDTAGPGVTELDLQAATTSAAIKAGGQPHFLYLSSTSMAQPDRIVPQQDLTQRPLQPGDAVIFELSASLGGYSGQVLRTMTIEAELTERYRQLHEVAWEAFHAIAATIRPGSRAAEAVNAGSVIEARGFTICDDLVHGYGGGYLPPVLRTPSATHGPVPDFVFEENMTVVIQPNVVSGDAGVQVGELVRVTRDGVTRFHGVPQAALRSRA